MESHFETSEGAPLLIGGIPDEDTQSVSYGIEIPGALSFLAFNDPDAEVAGLDQIPRDQWPPVLPVHLAFQVMVGAGSALALLALIWFFALRFRPRWLESRRLLWALVVAAPLGFIAIEAGWTVTEVGRQPWIIYGIMRTSEGLTPVPGQVWHLLAFSALYALIGFSAVWMWRRQVRLAHRVEPPDEDMLRWAGIDAAIEAGRTAS
jgi:cytochrome d ubiquinol oxidase subunit I